MSICLIHCCKECESVFGVGFGTIQNIWSFRDLLSMTPKQFMAKKNNKIMKISEQNGSSCLLGLRLIV